MQIEIKWKIKTKRNINFKIIKNYLNSIHPQVLVYRNDKIFVRVFIELKPLGNIYKGCKCSKSFTLLKCSTTPREWIIYFI